MADEEIGYQAKTDVRRVPNILPKGALVTRAAQGLLGGAQGLNP